MYQDLVLATDGSEGAAQATEHAIELAYRLESTLHILSVAEEGPHSTEKRDEMRTDAESDAEAAVAEAERAAADVGIEVTTTILDGVPQDEIVGFADEQGMDMIIVGTVGRSGLDKLVVGSVAEEVIQNASVPVVTVRESEAE
ncbi:UspA domain protein [Natrialba magadii ATCC 43099]|uniref:UspA domain protein n=1 Tax=Natrialba magadii (strain ATCC 43099 / DSM 3394 / CCM 3739 / CIP 104546 / IAM 13178 / JCM 8861 / NBRC 102185 / NCIMB 2190 / MS3) TaxID=547559 RepID=D3SR51_NATMM|nr:universal stress protein [Natrialba magadii]ADD06607.1 UspA domain protein [Natrialba magadii ATCC 43099]ELY31931.1 UspA domain-containing protein [Natrialba magadii ATCC 43099]